jgi:hypothetical protein
MWQVGTVAAIAGAYVVVNYAVNYATGEVDDDEDLVNSGGKPGL